MLTYATANLTAGGVRLTGLVVAGSVTVAKVRTAPGRQAHRFAARKGFDTWIGLQSHTYATLCIRYIRVTVAR
ncbi:hypothetical protein SAMN04488554_3618 [Ruania alba]|uniref:Uncharacterized protein n=1 Tax=Ruania alba TaxID=648782 RepID=A0A1H5MSU5_9MICO|nr:hypothetical protein SAMN04488554_3618 [Ruania alba]